MTYSVNRVDLRLFAGRVADLTGVERRHREARSWMMRAGRRMGKTMLLRKYVEVSAIPVAYVDCQSVPADGSPRDFFGRVTFSRDTADQSVGGFNDIAELEEHIASSEERHLILIDEPDALLRQVWGVGALENLRSLVSNSTAAGKVSIGMAGGFSLGARLMSAGSPIANVCEDIGLDPLEERGVADLVRLGSFGEEADSVANDVWETAGGHPYLVQALLLEFERKGWPLSDASLSHLTSVLEPHVRKWVADLGLSGGDSIVPHVIGARRSQELISSGLFRRAQDRLEPNGAWCASILMSLSSEAAAEDGHKAVLPWTLGEALRSGEGSQVEFKASLRWDHATRQVSKVMESEVVRAIAGMMNAKGGVVIIGVNDDLTAAGIEPDLRTVHRKNLDGWQLRLRNLLTENLDRHLVLAIDVTFDTMNDKHVALIHVPRFGEPVFLDVDHRKVLPVRSGNSTMMLDAADAYEFLRSRPEI